MRTSTEYPMNEGSGPMVCARERNRTGLEILAEGPGLDVLHDADDLVGHTAAGDALANRIFVLEQPLREGFIDDGQLGCRGAFVAEITAGDTRGCPGYRSSRG